MAKPCKVSGVLDGALYDVVVTGKKSRPVVGSARVVELVKQWTGRTVLVTPMGPAHVGGPHRHPLRGGPIELRHPGPAP